MSFSRICCTAFLCLFLVPLAAEETRKAENPFLERMRNLYSRESTAEAEGTPLESTDPAEAGPDPAEAELAPKAAKEAPASEESEEEKQVMDLYLERAMQLYKETAGEDAVMPEDAQQWVMEDLKKIGDWEYQVLRISDRDPDRIQAAMNELGSQRWECFFVRTVDGAALYHFKRQKTSYLQKASQMNVPSFGREGK